MTRAALWSELLPLDEVGKPEVLALLARYGLELRLACFDGATEVRELASVLGRARDAGVAVTLWPMLGDDDGRWANVANGARFAGYVQRLSSELEAREVPVRSVVVDIEPQIGRMEKWLGRGPEDRARTTKASREERREGARALRALYDELAGRGVSCGAAVVPSTMLGAWGAGLVERALGLPVDVAPWAPASVMLYSSMMEGYARGWISRERSVSLLARGAKGALARFGARTEVSLGVVGTGALGDEPVYRDPGELRQDVRVVREAGVTRLALFDLRGVLTRGAPERWLDALTGA